MISGLIAAVLFSFFIIWSMNLNHLSRNTANRSVKRIANTLTFVTAFVAIIILMLLV